MIELLLRLALFLALTAGALSIGLAWAIAGPARWVRSLLVWVFSMALALPLAMWAFHAWNLDVRDGPFAPTLIIVTAVMTALALGVAAWQADVRGLAAEGWGMRILSLTRVHLEVLFYAGILGWGVIMWVLLSRIH